jgi:hypothetical protein
MQITSRLKEIYKRPDIPEKNAYLKLVEKATSVLHSEPSEYRPAGSNGLAGGLVYLKKDVPTIIVPDIHARMEFILNILFFKPDNNASVIERLYKGTIQIVCLGDGFHAEARAAKRWKDAYEEFTGGYKHHKHMDSEMRESLGLMEMIMELKTAFPPIFHFLKGNHENITNERGEGNYPFYKFSNEGLMVQQYVQRFYGEDFLNKYSSFEKAFPLLTVGKNFIISHAEPVSFFDKSTVIEYRKNPDVIYGLTWTANDSAEDGSVEKMIKYYLPETEYNKAYYFGGHRPVRGKYNRRADGHYIQLHNPAQYSIAYIKVDCDINLEEDIIVLNDNIHNIMKGEL